MGEWPITIAQAGSALRRRQVSAVELLEASLAAMDRFEPEIHAMTEVTEDLARALARDADRRLQDGDPSPMLGIPVVLKDLIDVEGVRTTAGSRVLHDNVATADAQVWERLRRAGAVLAGKANTHEFAYGGTTEPTRNPADPSRIVGGSSGGPAAAVAAGYCLAAVGTDTAGSIRIPANLCGVAGLKPTASLVSSRGVVPLSFTLDCVGPMGKTVADLEPVLKAIADVPPSEARQADGRAGRVILVSNTGPMEDSVAGGVAAAVSAFEQLGAVVEERALPGFADAVFANFTVIGVEAAAWHRRWEHRAQMYTPYVRSRLADGRAISGVQYLDALAAARRLADEIDRLLDEFDMLLLPGVPLPASPAYDDQVWVQGSAEDRDTALCRNTALANLTGHPALAVPAGLDGDLPVGVQLVGRRGEDLRLLEAGGRLESLLPEGLPGRLRSRETGRALKKSDITLLTRSSRGDRIDRD